MFWIVLCVELGKRNAIRLVMLDSSLAIRTVRLGIDDHGHFVVTQTPFYPFGKPSPKRLAIKRPGFLVN